MNDVQIKINPEFESLIPKMLQVEFDKLEADIKKHGCIDKIILWNNTIVDGHHRYGICTRNNILFETTSLEFADKNEAMLWIIDHQAGKRNADIITKVLLAEKKNEIKKEQARANQGKRTDLYQNSDKGSSLFILKEIARDAGCSHDTVHKILFIKKHAPEKLDYIRDNHGSTSICHEYNKIKDEHTRSKRVKNIGECGDLTTDKKYPVILADPPWTIDSIFLENRKIENQYPCMTLDDICALPVKELATPDAILFLWVITGQIQEAFKVLDAWGFTYKTHAIWVKDKIGLGHWVRNQHEVLFIATRGSFPVPETKNRPPSVIHAPRTKHSKKPDEAYELIETICPEELGKIELFARSQRGGWDVWGNEAV